MGLAVVSYQPAVGYWQETPTRQLLWAVKQVLHAHQTKPEQAAIDKWTDELAKVLTRPVSKWRWEREYQRVAKDANSQVPHVPQEIVDAWAALEKKIDALWLQAGAMRVKTEGLPFLEADMQKSLAQIGQLVRSIPERDRPLLQKLLEKAYEEQHGQFGFARMIRAEWKTVAKQRARLIAVTEWNRAASAATFEAYMRQGVATKQWITVGDSRVCAMCEANAADGDIPITDSFFSGDLYPPAHPGCRCAVSS